MIIRHYNTTSHFLGRKSFAVGTLLGGGNSDTFHFPVICEVLRRTFSFSLWLKLGAGAQGSIFTLHDYKGLTFFRVLNGKLLVYIDSPTYPLTPALSYTIPPEFLEGWFLLTISVKHSFNTPNTPQKNIRLYINELKRHETNFTPVPHSSRSRRNMYYRTFYIGHNHEEGATVGMCVSNLSLFNVFADKNFVETLYNNGKPSDLRYWLFLNSTRFWLPLTEDYVSTNGSYIFCHAFFYNYTSNGLYLNKNVLGSNSDARNHILDYPGNNN